MSKLSACGVPGADAGGFTSADGPTRIMCAGAGPTGRALEQADAGRILRPYTEKSALSLSGSAHISPIIPIVRYNGDSRPLQHTPHLIS